MCHHNIAVVAPRWVENPLPAQSRVACLLNCAHEFYMEYLGDGSPPGPRTNILCRSDRAASVM